MYLFSHVVSVVDDRPSPRLAGPVAGPGAPVNDLAAAVTFTWLGMVLAISFLEAPLKFRAPGVTIPIGLGIGRLVFRALNAVEAVLAVIVIVAVAAGNAAVPVLVFASTTSPPRSRRSSRYSASASRSSPPGD